MLPRLWSTLAAGYRRFQSHNCPTMCAAVAFYTLLWLIPLLLLATTVFGHVVGEHQARQRLIEVIHGAAPGSSGVLVRAIRSLSPRAE